MNDTLASAEWDQTMKMWDTRSGQETLSMKGTVVGFAARYLVQIATVWARLGLGRKVAREYPAYIRRRNGEQVASSWRALLQHLANTRRMHENLASWRAGGEATTSHVKATPTSVVSQAIATPELL
jgi:hypothetical protein